MGRDRLGLGQAGQHGYFNPLSPHGERRRRRLPPSTSGFISIHSPRMGRDHEPQRAAILTAISIHSPRMGRDHLAHRCPQLPGISIHSPRMGRDRQIGAPQIRRIHFNPLSPHGERRPALVYDLHQESISIHSPRMGRDSKRTQLFEEKNWRICTTLYLFASKEVLPADKKLFREKKQTVFFGANRTGKPWELPYRTNH